MPASGQVRRFPQPWSAVEIPGGWKVVDANGIAIAYVYSVDQRRQLALGADALNDDEARRIARGIAKLPDLLRADR
jgi:hypothetical protein